MYKSMLGIILKIMKYEIEDTVKIKDFNANSMFCGMKEFCGKIAKIVGKGNDFYYINIDTGYYQWREDLFEDIHEFKPFDKVLVRDENDEEWLPNFFFMYNIDSNYPYLTMNDTSFKQCIPYKGNEILAFKVIPEGPVIKTTDIF